MVNVASEAGLRRSAAGAAYTASKHAVIGLTKNSAVMYGRRPALQRRRARATITNIEANWRSQLAAERLGPLMYQHSHTRDRGPVAASVTFRSRQRHQRQRRHPRLRRRLSDI